ncbi:MAG: PspC domain-containing protein [bacterium]|nr:PspC domain-containing protein [bacterium]
MAAKKESTEKEELPFHSLPSRLYRSEKNRVLAGVAGGIGEYAGIDPTIIRLVFVLLTIFGGSGILLYLVLWLVVPTESSISTTNDQIKENIAEMKGKAKGIAMSMKIENQSKNRSWWAIVLILVGVVFVLQNFGIYNLDFGKFWPFLLILLGLLILRKR